MTIPMECVIGICHHWHICRDCGAHYTGMVMAGSCGTCNQRGVMDAYSDSQTQAEFPHLSPGDLLRWRFVQWLGYQNDPHGEHLADKLGWTVANG